MTEVALAEGTPEASFLYHSALIRLAHGDEAAARDFLDRSLDLNPDFSPLHTDSARQLLAELESKR